MRNFGKCTRTVASLLAGVSVLALASQAMAQSDSKSESVEAVTVTGSRVITNGNDMPTPVTIVTPESLTDTMPSNVMDGLQALPVFAGGRSPQANPGNSSQNNAAHQLNLRNIGITRTLVLFDGRRIAPTAPTGEVNADIIPEMLLQRVDVVTGGASAVYGSDAVAGVVNFITNKDFDGFKMKGHAGVSEYGDGKEQNLGAAWGMDVLAGRGHVELSYEWFNNDGIAWNDKLKRQWARDVWTVQGAGSTANPYKLVKNTRLSSTSFDGVILSGPLNRQEFTQNGILSPYVHGTPTGGNGVESGGDGGYYYQASLVSKYVSNQLFGRFDYDLTDDVHAYVEASGTKIQNLNNHQTNEFRNITLSASNAYLDPAYQQAMIGAGTTTFKYSKMMTQAPPLQPDSWTTGYIVNAGLDGNLGKYKWDFSFVHNENQQYTRNNANIDLQKAYAALDAVKDPSTGNIVCNVTLTNPGLYPGCVPLNLFGPTSESQQSLDYILTVTKYWAKTSMDDVGGSFTGSPFDDWAGPVQMALSAEWRQTQYDLTSTAQPDHANCTGLRFNCTSSTLQYISNVLGDVHGLEQGVWETALETDAPLLHDVPYVQSLDLNSAVRYTDYDTSGTVWSWKVGATWQVDDQLSFRATRSRDIRAPNLNDLFSPALINPAGVTDVHTGIVGQAPFITNSNPNLEPEVAITTTAGVIYRPEWLENFSLSVDYYKIKIGNAITTIQGQSPTIQNICENSGGTSPFCALIQRPLPFSDHSAANFVTGFLSQPENAQSVKTEGVDIEANYQTDIGPGHFAARLLSTYQPMLETTQFPGAPVLNAANAVGLPSFRASLFLKYIWDDISVDILERLHSSTKWNADRALIYAEPDLPWAAYTNVTLTYDWHPVQLYLSVQNLFNKQPTPYGNVGGSSGVPGLFGGFVPGDDAIGRYYTVGFRYDTN
jgi:outer membrane receptor protein involved in Fe transport